MKKNILLVLITAIIVGGIGVYAGAQISAEAVSYDETHTVKDKIDDLYTSIDKYETMVDWVILKKSGDQTSIMLKAKENQYKYYYVREISKGSGATCTVQGNNHYDYLHAIELNKDYETKYEGVEDEYRVFITASGGFCSYQVVYHN